MGEQGRSLREGKEDMIDRVAMAIQAAMSAHVANWASDYELDALARAAIEAMREPTAAMVIASWHYPSGDFWLNKKKTWDAIIDAALSLKGVPPGESSPSSQEAKRG